MGSSQKNKKVMCRFFSFLVSKGTNSLDFSSTIQIQSLLSTAKANTLLSGCHWGLDGFYHVGF